MVSSELKFTKAIRELLAFSMIEAREDVSAYSVHPVVHEWALQVLGRERRAELSWLVVMIVGKAIPESTEQEYWIKQQRLISHADCCYSWIESGEDGKYFHKDNEPCSYSLTTPFQRSSFLCEFCQLYTTVCRGPAHINSRHRQQLGPSLQKSGQAA
jgi:hypothetical protein